MNRAYKNLERGSIGSASDMLYEANINRSPTSYLLNPGEERAMYPEGDTDKRLLQLSYTSDNGTDLGVLNWFSVHGTSNNNTNRVSRGKKRKES